MAMTTWDVIGGDVLKAVEEHDGSATIPREEVIECVMDADYMLTHGRDKEAYEHFMKMDPNEQLGIMREAFPFEIYGW